MKIAIIRKKYTFYGGSESFSQNLIKRLAEEGHEIYIFAIKWDTSEQLKNIHFHKVPAVTFNSFLRDFTFALSTYRILKHEHFHIIQSHDKTLYQDIYRAGDGCHIEWLRQRWRRIGPLGKVSIILNPHHWLILVMERLIFRGHRFKKIIAISELVKRNIIENYHVDERDMEVIYNGVDLKRFNPENRKLYREEVRKNFSIERDEFVVLFVGSGFERKGVEYLLKAVELIPELITVLIVGKGSEKRMRRFIKRQRVIFCGPQKEIHKYYAASDVFVFPTMYEPFGNVHLEALASGLPVITTRLSGASEIIRDGLQGFIIDKPEDIEKIAEKILFLMDRDENQRMSSEARKLAEHFSFSAYTDKMIKLYQDVLRSS
jgi:UDP-glucose:(heptosyl)LPS alpha-1,3-glucosyltransferase